MAVEELTDLKEVWSELTKVWEGLEQLKEQPWLSVNPRKLRQALDTNLEQIKAFPARLRQYASYEHISKTIKGYMKVMTKNYLQQPILINKFWFGIILVMIFRLIRFTSQK